MSALLRFAGVTCRRGGRLLFEELELALAAGESLLVTGPNGSGKSSLIRIAAGLLPPESGTVDRAPLALADDNLALDPELPLQRALGFWGGAVDQGLEAVGLTGLRDVPVRLLSSGQRKRATLARVAGSGTPLWLLDEPLNGLDSTGIQLLNSLIQRHLTHGGAVLAASHAALAGNWRTLELGR